MPTLWDCLTTRRGEGLSWPGPRGGVRREGGREEGTKGEAAEQQQRVYLLLSNRHFCILPTQTSFPVVTQGPWQLGTRSAVLMTNQPWGLRGRTEARVQAPLCSGGPQTPSSLGLGFPICAAWGRFPLVGVTTPGGAGARDAGVLQCEDSPVSSGASGSPLRDCEKALQAWPHVGKRARVCAGQTFRGLFALTPHGWGSRGSGRKK